jgi:hypothetical protein
MELTTHVRCLIGADHKAKGPQLIKKSLDLYINWAAADGEYDKLNIVSNILTAVVDISIGADNITRWMETQLANLAQSHRDFLRDGEEGVFESVEASVIGQFEKVGDLERAEDKADERRMDIDKAQETPRPKKTRPRYRRKPPVVYGLFVVSTTVMVLTVDASKEPEDAFTSYQVEVSFGSKQQGVWNAMTLAIVVCLARDEMMERKLDFDVFQPDTESDPDA